MAVAPGLSRVVPFFTALLPAVPGKDGGVDIQGVIVILQIAKKSLV